MPNSMPGGRPMGEPMPEPMQGSGISPSLIPNMSGMVMDVGTPGRRPAGSVPQPPQPERPQPPAPARTLLPPSALPQRHTVSKGEDEEIDPEPLPLSQLLGSEQTATEVVSLIVTMEREEKEEVDPASMVEMIDPREMEQQHKKKRGRGKVAGGGGRPEKMTAMMMGARGERRMDGGLEEEDGWGRPFKVRGGEVKVI